MITFITSIVLLFLGYALYSRLAEKIFGIDVNAQTPAYYNYDGVDYVPLPWYKIFLIQFLNIAGLGPIFGAIAGAMWGPVAFLWIVLGCIFGGAIHDYFSGMLSVKYRGLSITEIVSLLLGKNFKVLVSLFILFIMILVGAIFITGPAKILSLLSRDFLDIKFWSICIFVYYFLASFLPIDKLIAKIYPIFGLFLLFMGLSLIISLIVNDYKIPELTISSFKNQHSNPSDFPIFPMLFITVACGAISGFHSTQSPLMARCITNEKYGRRVFYGAMIIEGLVALIWAAIAMAFFGSIEELNKQMNEHNGNAAWAVNLISNTLLGKIGTIFAILGVVSAPITSGDTALRSARLIIADFFKLNQKDIKNRLLIMIPLFIVVFIITLTDFSVIWRYMAWSNQTLACIVLWTISVYLKKNNKFYLITFIPAFFMTIVCTSYILISPEGFKMNYFWANIISSTFSVLISSLFFLKVKKRKH